MGASPMKPSHQRGARPEADGAAVYMFLFMLSLLAYAIHALAKRWIASGS